ncbi:MAG TPA: ABC transporter permease [Acidobacteriaceae bacterium]|jgi:predicted permease
MTLIQDVRYAVRQLRKTPGFTLTAVLTLALGIGANAAIFTLVHAVLLKNLPVADPKTLVRLGDHNDCCVGSGVPDNGNYSVFSLTTWQYVKKNAPEFQELSAIQAGFEYVPIIARQGGTRHGGSEEPARSVVGEFVSGNYFRTFGLRPQVGRLFTDADDVAGAPMTAVMSYTTWQREYDSDPAVVGSTFWINTKAVTIAGIAPQGFFGDRLSSTPPDFYLPIETMAVLANVSYVHDPNQNWIYMIGRLKPGVSIPALEATVSALVRQSLEDTRTFANAENKPKLPKVHVVLTPGGGGIQDMQEQYGTNLRMLMWISGAVLLIACANIANLLLVRGMGRRAEMSVRAALGATRRRVIQQLLTESLLLAGLGGIAGLAVAYAGTRMLLMLAFPGNVQDVPIDAAPSMAVMGFACGLSLVTGVLFGVAPAWIAARAEPADALRSGSRTTTTRASLLQRGLVVVQAALSLVLLVGAGLFAQSLHKLQSTDLKLDARNRYIVHINPSAAGYSEAQLEALSREMEERFHALPGVVKVGISTYTPMEEYNDSWSLNVQGKPDLHLSASYVRANAEYFDAVGTHVLTGRGIRSTDTSTAPAVAVVNKEFVKTFFQPGENPIGHRFGQGRRHAGDFEIVGVVEDTAYTSLRWKDHRMYFIPLMQRPASDPESITNNRLYVRTIVLETARPMSDMESLARRTLAGINPNLSVVKFQTFGAQIADRFNDDRMIARLTMLFGALALLLAAVGLYGVTAYTVALRTSEIGIRMALGAERGGVVAMVMRGAMMQTLLGLAIGIPVALVCVRFVKAQLYEITSADARVMAGAILTLAVAACVAGMIPARRAASIDPMQALRTE